VTAPASQGSRLRQLLERPEVQTHLKLTVRQKSDLGLNPRPRSNDRRPGGRGGESGTPGSAPDGEAGRITLRVTGGPNDSPEERQRRLNEVMESARADIEAAGRTRDEKIKEVLSPEQYARLLELDLQRRGPLALGDAAVAEQVKLAANKRVLIANLALEAQRKISEARVEAIREQGLPAYEQQMKNRLSPIRQKTDKVRREAEASILAQLSPDETARWQATQGEPFTFRIDR
jgi:hypothetical protein